MTKEVRKRLKELEKTKGKSGSLYSEKEPKVKKKKNMKIKPKHKFLIALNNFKFAIMDMIFEINGIDKDEYLFSDGVSIDISFAFDKKFKAMSMLGFYEKETSDVNGLKFRGRFVTKLLFFFLKNIDDVVEVINEESLDEYSSKWKVRYNILTQITKRLNSFIIVYLSKDAYYHKPLEDLLEVMLIVTRRDASAGKVIKTFREQSEFVKRACKTGEYDEDLMINNILKLAYLMSTENVKLKKCPEYQEGITKRDYLDVKEQIGELGYAIMQRREKEKSHPMYKIFTKANPLYYSKFPDVNDAIELNIGTKALVYLRVLLDDQYVDRYINKLIAW